MPATERDAETRRVDLWNQDESAKELRSWCLAPAVTAEDFGAQINYVTIQVQVPAGMALGSLSWNRVVKTSINVFLQEPSRSRTGLSFSDPRIHSQLLGTQAVC